MKNLSLLFVLTVTFLFFLTVILEISYAGSVPYQLKQNEFSVDIGIRFTELGTMFSGTLNYGISSVIGYLGTGIVILDDNKEPYLSLSNIGISIPPSPVFSLGLSSNDDLWQTGMKYWTNAEVMIGFEKAIDNYADRTIFATRDFYLSTTLGIMKELFLENNYVISPFVGISYTNAWVTAESKMPEFIYRETESDNYWTGQLGLMMKLSPKTNIAGIVGFSFESSDYNYNVSLSFQP